MGDSIGHKIGADHAEELKAQAEAEDVEKVEQGDSSPEKAAGEGIHPYGS